MDCRCSRSSQSTWFRTSGAGESGGRLPRTTRFMQAPSMREAHRSERVARCVLRARWRDRRASLRRAAGSRWMTTRSVMMLARRASRGAECTYWPGGIEKGQAVPVTRVRSIDARPRCAKGLRPIAPAGCLYLSKSSIRMSAHGQTECVHSDCDARRSRCKLLSSRAWQRRCHSSA
jgi:hypothetical protein